jgi:hypothetical protein
MSADENRVLVVDDSPVYRHLISIRCSRLRDECLNANWFTSLSDARRKIETWRQDYNENVHTVRCTTCRPQSLHGQQWRDSGNSLVFLATGFCSARLPIG